MLFKKNIFFILLLLLTIHTQAQHRKNKIINISGVISNNGTPIPFCNIYAEGTIKGTTSNENGEYNLKIKHGDYTITAQSMGFKKESKKVHLDENIRLNFNLQEDALGLDQVVITATKTS